MNWYLIGALYVLCALETMVLVRRIDRRYDTGPTTHRMEHSQVFWMGVFWPLMWAITGLQALWYASNDLLDWMANN